MCIQQDARTTKVSFVCAQPPALSRQRREDCVVGTKAGEMNTSDAVLMSQHAALWRLTADRWTSDLLPLPEPARRQSGTFSKGLELGPDDFRMADTSSQPAVRPGDDVLATDQPGIPDQALCHQLWVLDEVGGVA